MIFLAYFSQLSTSYSIFWGSVSFSRERGLVFSVSTFYSFIIYSGVYHFFRGMASAYLNVYGLGNPYIGWERAVGVFSYGLFHIQSWFYRSLLFAKCIGGCFMVNDITGALVSLWLLLHGGFSFSFQSYGILPLVALPFQYHWFLYIIVFFLHWRGWSLIEGARK